VCRVAQAGDPGGGVCRAAGWGPAAGAGAFRGGFSRRGAGGGAAWPHGAFPRRQPLFPGAGPGAARGAFTARTRAKRGGRAAYQGPFPGGGGGQKGAGTAGDPGGAAQKHWGSGAEKLHKPRIFQKLWQPIPEGVRVRAILRKPFFRRPFFV